MTKEFNLSESIINEIEENKTQWKSIKRIVDEIWFALLCELDKETRDNLDNVLNYLDKRDDK